MSQEYGGSHTIDMGAINPAAKLEGAFPERIPSVKRVDAEYGTVVFDRGGFYEQVREYAQKQACAAEDIEVSATDDEIFSAFLYNTDIEQPTTGDDVPVLPEVYTENAEIVDDVVTVLRSAVASVVRDEALRYMDPLEEREVGLLIETEFDPETLSLTASPQTYDLPDERDLWEEDEPYRHESSPEERMDASLHQEDSDSDTVEEGDEPLFGDPISRHFFEE